MDPRDLRKVGKYRVKRFISEGGMAWVFEVEDPMFQGRRLALKMLKPEAAAGEQFRRFEAEASLLAGIDHPNVITIFDFGRDPDSGCYYFTMTLVDGPSLGEKGVIPVDECIAFYLEALAGLATLHDRQIVHRDIKPGNILTHSDGRAVLADLGIARVQTQDSDLTKTTMAIGTIKYMAPEQARGHTVTPASDVLSMGLTIYQSLTGRSVYDSVEGIDSSSGQSILFYLGSMSGQSGSQLPMVFPEHVSRAIQKVLLRACRFAPEDRYQNAREMRDALLEALRDDGQPPSRSFRVSPVVVAGAVVAGALAAGAWWYLNSSIGRSSAEDTLRVVAELRQSSADLIEQMAALSPPADAALLESARERVSHAGIFVARGRTKLDAGRSSGALALFDDGVAYYRTACQELLDGDLNERTEAAAADARARAKEMATPAAQQIRPDGFAALAEIVAKLDAPGRDVPPCTAGNMQLARLENSATVYTQLASLERDLKAEWPRLSARAQAAAETAEAEASRLPSESPSYLEPMAEGRRALQKGREARENEEYLDARRSFARAREAFDTASRLAPAAQARDRARALIQGAAGVPFSEQGVVESSLTKADNLFANEHWKEAQQEYEALANLLESLIADKQQASGALAAANASESSRTTAVREGAPSSAAAPFADAERVRAKAREDLEAMRYAEAEGGFAQAQSLYAQAAISARAQLAESRSAADAAHAAAAELMAGGGCEALSESAQSQCEVARESLRLGERALEDLDAGAAEQSFGHARERFAAAAAAHRDFLAKRPQPPYIASRTPKDEKVRAFRNSAVKFEVAAKDPNAGDTLRYVWTVDDDAMGTSQPHFTYRGDRDARVKVQVDDGHGGSAEESWTLSFTNRKPKLSLSPSSRSLGLTVGDQRSFTASAIDPDGESVTYQYLIDGKSVATGPKYRFTAAKPGRYELVARAIDPGGASTRSVVQIDVKPKTTPKPAPPPVQQATSQPKRPPAERPKPPPQVASIDPIPLLATDVAPRTADPEEAGVAALREYEAAYEALDLDRLGDVWIMNRNQRKSMASLFQNVDRLKVDVKIKTIYVEDESVYIDFDQTIEGEGKARLAGKPARMTATVIPRSGGAWVISSILPRG